MPPSQKSTPALTATLATPGVQASQVRVSSIPLGRGSFGSVWRGTFSGCSVAVKICSVSPQASSKETRSAAVQFQRESTRYQRLRHPCITQFFCVVQDPATSQLLLVTELMKGGSLFDAIGALRRAGVTRLHNEGLLRIARHVTNGLSYLHASHFSFGDLKTMNILLSEPPDVSRATFTSSTQAKLCDFGLSRNLKHLVTPEKARRPGPGETQIPARNGPAGTFAYLAPEAFSGLPTDDADAPRRADVFALGIVLWELATLKRPWPGRQPLQLIRLVKKEGLRPEWPADCSSLPAGYIQLVESCWQADPLLRPSVDEVASALNSMYAAVPSAEVDGNLSGRGMFSPSRLPSLVSRVSNVSTDREGDQNAYESSLLSSIDVVRIDEEEDLDQLSLDGTLAGDLSRRASSSVASVHPGDFSAVTGESHLSTAKSPESADYTPIVKSLDSMEKRNSYFVPVDVEPMDDDIEQELADMQTLSMTAVCGENDKSVSSDLFRSLQHSYCEGNKPPEVKRKKIYNVPENDDVFDELERELLGNRDQEMDMPPMHKHNTGLAQVSMSVDAGSFRAVKPPLAKRGGFRSYTLSPMMQAAGNVDVDLELNALEKEEGFQMRHSGVSMYTREHFR